MTENEIIKALECCLDCNCKDCPCCRVIDGGTHCTEIDEEEILNLINRQKAEIDILIRKKDTLRDEICELEAEVEKLKKFKYYFDDLYGLGLEVAGWHHNGMLEPFDSFYNSAIKEMTDYEKK